MRGLWTNWVLGSKSSIRRSLGSFSLPVLTKYSLLPCFLSLLCKDVFPLALTQRIPALQESRESRSSKHPLTFDHSHPRSRNPRTTRLLRCSVICAILGCTLNDLYTESGMMPASSSPTRQPPSLFRSRSQSTRHVASNLNSDQLRVNPRALMALG